MSVILVVLVLAVHMFGRPPVSPQVNKSCQVWEGSYHWRGMYEPRNRFRT